MFVDTNPFLFRGNVCGAMVRLSATPIVNVTSGGGEKGILCFARAPRLMSRVQIRQFARFSQNNRGAFDAQSDHTQLRTECPPHTRFF
jgi:hypothetical protein